MHQYIPEGKRTGMKIVCLVLFGVGAALFFLPAAIQNLPYQGLYQTAGVAVITAAIVLMGRFLLRHYLYRIGDDGEGVDLVVDELSRRGRYTVCRLSLSGLVRAEAWSAESRPPRGKKLYNYCVDVMPQDSWILEFEDGDDRIFLRLTPDETMKRMLADAMKGERT